MENEITTEQLVDLAVETIHGITKSIVENKGEKAFELLNDYASKYSERIIQETQKALKNKNNQ